MTELEFTAVVARERATAVEALATQLDAMCESAGLDPWEAWRRPAHHRRINAFQHSIAHLTGHDALSTASYPQDVAA